MILRGPDLRIAPSSGGTADAAVPQRIAGIARIGHRATPF
jgi:hypothetical protein